MNETTQQSHRHVWLFFLLSFGYSWILWTPFVLSRFGIIQPSDALGSLTMPAIMLGAFGPFLSATVLIVYTDGWSGLRRFFHKALNLHIKPVYYMLAFLVPLLITAIAHYFVNLTGIDTLPANLFPEDLTIPVIVLIVPYFLFILLAGGGQEEFGWRGYVQEPLQEHFGILGASMLLGFLWGLWHLPLWFMPEDGHSYYSFFAFLIFTISMSVIIGWLYNASGKKLVVPWIFHTVSNVSVPFFPILHSADVPQPGYWIWAGVNVLVAVGMTLWYRHKLTA